jgi:uncharacterized protein (DUF3084 family)
MRNVNSNSIAIAISASILVLYFTIGSNNKLNKAINTIDTVQKELNIVKDSLQNAHKSLTEVIKKLDFAENELRILQAERELIELDFLKKRAKTQTELQHFKQEIKRIEDRKNELIEIAKQFEL